MGTLGNKIAYFLPFRFGSFRLCVRSKDSLRCLVPGAALGVPAVCRGSVHLPVAGRHRREAGPTHQQQLPAGRAVRPRLRLALHGSVPSRSPVNLKAFFFFSSSSFKWTDGCNRCLCPRAVSLQCSWCWEPASRCRWAQTPTGCSSAASPGCSCSTAPTGRHTCRERCASACESYCVFFAFFVEINNTNVKSRQNVFYLLSALCKFLIFY